MGHRGAGLFAATVAATAASAMRRGLPRWRKPRARAAPMRWRSVRCTRCSAPIRRASGRIRLPPGCSSIRCMHRQPWCSARRHVGRMLRAEGLAETFERLEAEPLIDWPAAARAKHRLLRAMFDAFIDGEGRPLHLDFAQLSRRWRGTTDAARRVRGAACRAGSRLAPATGAIGRRICATPAAPRSRCSRHRTSDEVLFHCFLQWLTDRSLGIAQQRARAGGMRIGSDRRSGGGHGPGRQPCVEPAGRPARRPFDRCAAGYVQSARAGLGADRILAARAGGRRVRPVPRHGARGVAQHRRRAHRPCDGADAAVAGPAGRRSRRWRLPGVSAHRPAAAAGARIAAASTRSSSARTLARCRLASARCWRSPACTACACCGSNANGQAFMPPEAWDHSAVAMTSTHDLPTVAGWWHGCDITTRAACGRLGVGVNEVGCGGRTCR